MLITYYYIFMMHKNDICSNPISLSFRGGSFSFCSICYTVVCVHLTTNNRCGIKEVFFHKAPYQYTGIVLVLLLYCSNSTLLLHFFFILFIIRKKEEYSNSDDADYIDTWYNYLLVLFYI